MSDPPFVGVQLGAHSVFDEGPEHLLDLLREHGRVNSVQVFTHTYYGPGGIRSGGVADHGAGEPPADERPLTPVWVRTHDELYRSTPMRHLKPDPQRFQYAERDVLDALIDPAHQRGMTVYPRILEGFGPRAAELIPGFTQVMGLDCYGRRHGRPCWRHPDYRAWWLATVEDLFRHYDVDGLMLGPERDGPLGPLLHDGDPPTCFCEHCRTEARRRGIDADRAREGMQQLHAMMARLQRDRAKPTDGLFLTLLRLWMRYPEILAWEQLQADGKWNLHREIYGLVKTLKPAAQVGWHLCMYSLAWDVFARATQDYRRLSEFSDFLKPSVYFDVNAARLSGWIDRATERSVWADLDRERLHGFLYGIMGYPDSEPGPEQMLDRRFGPGYLRREIGRAVE